VSLHDAHLQFVVLVQHERVDVPRFLQVLDLQGGLGERTLQTLRGLFFGRLPFFGGIPRDCFGHLGGEEGEEGGGEALVAVGAGGAGFE
jgi:hypothetical protein